ncbi:oxygen-independent coproporphyrinogen III oxidase [Enterococcus hirae]|uniref:radical SAM family heme chaperone HemW n=1 Tax=Enterococcus hirae TaxID=1354 RepID=UPI000FF879E0|nr:radical SAM family heme chaperone HemW [Enterococcus hirae]EMF0165327.1 oxygen-independent coproporphyrinogen III oxidase [Enterococcus hirae]EMF0172881.1 oxygen-independent coproporphyrinogen III oxidase [Enterococcus hirae]EMF0188175.1 oxygen-independent coproporphyrinogen III oxidase [Enterococcus hirae]EMF0193206.1 oxygen-independent coproporphyrinogen III oxidase [Enterococcus hirae]EMF0217859.1 oxygen-independent coproporphyrinogen III oxidase [Enterococcus hirae]
MNETTNPAEQKVSAYIHIPFCEHICYYCDFNKVFLEGQPVDEYVEMLLKEMEITLKQHPVKELETLYVGGGTPTSLTAVQLDRLLAGAREILPFKEGKEFTVEANPGDLTKEKLQVMKNYGVNRLSMGVQTFDNRLLKKIGRKHTAEDVYQTMHFLEEENFTNVSIDLIYALPGQTLEGYRETLNQALALDLPHYSLYSLILENKTMFMNWVRQGRLELPDQETETRMFEETIQAMKKKGRHQYEISNFGLEGHESKHNLMYWNNDHYFGFGAGASGYLGNKRYRNKGPIQHYLRPLRAGELPVLETEVLLRENQIEEEMFLGLRKKIGISKQHFYERYQQTIESLYSKVLTDLEKEGLLVNESDRIYLTPKGTFLGNEVFERFLLEK